MTDSPLLDPAVRRLIERVIEERKQETTSRKLLQRALKFLEQVPYLELTTNTFLLTHDGELVEDVIDDMRAYLDA